MLENPFSQISCRYKGQKLFGQIGNVCSRGLMNATSIQILHVYHSDLIFDMYTHLNKALC